MPWTKTTIPDAMKNLTPDVRDKAVEIGNELLQQYEEPRAIRISIAQAKDWARRRNIEIWTNGGSRGRDQHIVPHEAGWAVLAEDAEQVTISFPTQKEALERAREIARNQHSEIVIHSSEGKIRDVVSPHGSEAT